MEKLQVLYEQIIEDDELMQELEDIIQYSTGKNEKHHSKRQPDI